MRRVTRPALSKEAQTYLNKRQTAIDLVNDRQTVNIEREWKSARQTKAMQSVVHVLRQMMGPRERCMYCVDSHGCDIEHFRPKAGFPEHAFRWSNMLLSCTQCGRFKGHQFPMLNGRALLIDPSVEDPWQHLDFIPGTGGLTARFDLRANDYSPRGVKTVEVLQLDRREVLETIYKATFRRLCRVVQVSLDTAAISSTALLAELQDADDHGLLPWCFGPGGQSFAPFSVLREQRPQVWADCRRALI